MELDKPVVANAIAKLLIPSIFPKVTLTFETLYLGLMNRECVDIVTGIYVVILGC